MPDSKITALTSILTSTDPVLDQMVIVDVSDTSMAGTGTTKRVSLNQLLGASGTATLASATITGDLTVDTSTLKVDSANNRVGVVNASPAAALDILGGKDSTNVIVGAPLSTVGGGAFANYSELLFKNTAGSNSDASIRAYGNVWNAAGSQLAFFTSNNSAVAERYRIDNTGVSTWSVGGSTAMTLNATGLGIGVGPSYPFHLRNSASAIGMVHSTNANGPYVIFQNSTANFGDIGSELSITGGGSAGNMTINSRFSSNLCFSVSDTVRMRIDASGNVGIGVTPSAWRSTNKALQVGSYSSLTSSSAGDLQLYNNVYLNSGGAAIYQSNGFATRYEQYQGGHAWYTAPSGTAGNAITFTQAMTLTAGGDLLVGKTATNSGTVGVEIQPNGNVWATKSASTSAATAWDTYSTGAGAYRFYVGMDGTVNATNTTISAISDARLKENVQDIDVGLGAILALKPRKFDWKAGKGKDIKGDRGFIAQEFEQVFPQLVDEWKDPAPEGEAPYKSVRQDLIPVLVKAIQELAAEVNALKNA